MIRRGSAIAGLAVLAGSVALSAAGSVRPGPDALLFAAIAAPSSVSYAGVVEVVRIGSHAAEASVYRIEHRAPDLTLRVYSAPSALSGDSVISKGDLSFSVDARRHRIVETRNAALDDRIALNDNYALLRKNYQIARKDDETFDGRSVVAIVLINKYNRQPAMLVRIDRETKIVLDKQEFALNGSLVGEVRFQSVRYTAAISDRGFRAPEAISARAGTDVRRTAPEPRQRRPQRRFPRPRAKGAARGLRAGRREPRRAQGRAHRSRTVFRRHTHVFALRKRDGLDAGHGGAAAGANAGRRTHRASTPRTAPWRCSRGATATLHYALVGELGRSELQQIAASIAP